MYQRDVRHAGADDEADANRQSASLAGVAVTLLLLVVGLFLVRELHAAAVVEDCLMSGRSNCEADIVAIP